MKSKKHVVGWTEYVDFPEWGITGIKAKTDTGARTSALHVDNIRKLKSGRIKFDVAIGRKKPFRYKTVTADVLKRSRVRSSNGLYTERYFVAPLMKIGPFEDRIELSLTSREDMIFRMLIGRKALEPDLIVDVSRRFPLSRPSRKKKKKVATKEKAKAKVKTKAKVEKTLPKKKALKKKAAKKTVAKAAAKRKS